MSEHVKVVTDASFTEDVLNATKPVLVDFWAPWCGPCRAIAPVVDELAAGMNGKFDFCKINIDENTTTPAQYGVMSIPTLLLFKNGEVVATKVGAVSKSVLMAFLESNG